MCGIAGYISIAPQPATLISRMTSLIRHRGPDDEGFALFSDLPGMPRVCGGPDTPDNVYQSGIAYAPKERLSALGNSPVRLALGHRRLSIVDLSALGHQPMCTPDRRLWIVYNGEIYNHLELRTELEGKGHKFLTHSDTEVILSAYCEWGAGCLERLNGMFAFLIYDALNGKLFAARDRFGIKPLYYRVSEQCIAFASEIKQFTVLPDWQAHTNGQRVYDFLNWGVSDHTDETLFADIYQMRPGHFVLFDVASWRESLLGNERLQSKEWYRLKAHEFEGTFEEASEEFRRLLIESIKLHLRADVPVGSCLSGGLDSSSIVCVIKNLLHSQGSHAIQKTFSACSEVRRFDERGWIDQVVGATGVEAHYVYPALISLFDESPKITWHQDEPFGSTSIYAQWNVFRLAVNNGVKVMLDGQGADEMLAGYHGFFAARIATLFKRLHWITLASEVSAMRRLYGYSPLKAAKYLANSQLPEPIRNLLRRYAGYTYAAPEWLDLDQLGARASNPFTEWGGDIRTMSIAQLTSSNLQMLLHWEDRNSMAHSVESRVPFLDHRLVEFVIGLPDEYKIAGGVTKRVLRSAMSGVLPDVIRDRMDKLGFVTPEEIWIREAAPDLFREKLALAIHRSQGVLKPSAMNVLEAMIAGLRPFNFSIWRMINFGEWMECFSAKMETMRPPANMLVLK